MAKLCAFLLVLAVACVARAVRIDLPSVHHVGKFFGTEVLPRTHENDPICNQGNGIYPHPTDCTKYYACHDSVSQERSCPEGFKFDTRRYCTPDEDADCGHKVPAGSMHAPGADVECPSPFGYFPYLEDCHQFFVCVENVPPLNIKKKRRVYSDNVGGCVEGNVCPDEQEAEEWKVCRKADGFYSHPNCFRYYKCVNFVPQVKECPRGKGFDPRKGLCTREKFNKCKENDIQGILRVD